MAKVVALKTNRGVKEIAREAKRLANEDVKWCRLIVKSSSLTAQQIADRSGIDARTVRAFIRGETKRPGFFTVNLIMNGLGYRVNWSAPGKTQKTFVEKLTKVG